MNIKISKMELTDLNNIKSCLLEDFDDFWSPSILKQELENKYNLNSHYFVAKLQEEIVGFAGFLIIIDELTITNIVVRKNKRTLGIGSTLLRFIINFSKDKNINLITLEVNEKNIPAIKLYQKYGFKQVGIRKNYYNNKDNAILMALFLMCRKGGKYEKNK